MLSHSNFDLFVYILHKQLFFFTTFISIDAVSLAVF